MQEPSEPTHQERPTLLVPPADIPNQTQTGSATGSSSTTSDSSAPTSNFWTSSAPLYGLTNRVATKFRASREGGQGPGLNTWMVRSDIFVEKPVLAEAVPPPKLQPYMAKWRAKVPPQPEWFLKLDARMQMTYDQEESGAKNQEGQWTKGRWVPVIDEVVAHWEYEKSTWTEK